MLENKTRAVAIWGVFAVVLSFILGGWAVAHKNDTYLSDKCRNLAIEKQDAVAYRWCSDKDFSVFYEKTHGDAEYSSFWVSSHIDFTRG
jgi:hypothetical protein